MARKTFFSFDYDRDNWRAANVRNSDKIKDEDEIGFIDKAKWEEIKKGGDAAIEKWIKSQLQNTTVTVVLIGSQTNASRWVHYEITQSHARGNGLLGVYIHNMKDSQGNTDTKGQNPFLKHELKRGNTKVSVPTYDWVNDKGRDNLATWIEAAAKAAGH